MSGLHFLFADLFHELECLQKMASDYIDPSRANVLPTLKRTLESIRDQGSSKHLVPWQVRPENALRTVLSRGGYAPDEQGEHNVFGEMSFIWQVAPSEPKKGPVSLLRLDGLASIALSVHERGPTGAEKELARWRVEVGDHQSPGTHFHVQIAYDTPPFPKSLDVPRLPAYPLTPMLAFESLLAELFQDQWRREADRDTTLFRTWNGVHRRRLQAFFGWQQRELKEHKLGTPLAVLKRIRPDLNEFVTP